MAMAVAAALVATAGTGRADDDALEFEAELSGAQEVTTPSGGVDTPASGSVDAEFDEELTRVRVRARVRSTLGDVAAAHFHCARPGQNGPIAFGLVSPGPCEFDGDRVSCTLTNEDLTDAGNGCMGSIGRPVSNIAALAFAMRDGLIYFNVHTTEFGSGEIRGQMLPEE
jgi:hypothetical protein